MGSRNLIVVAHPDDETLFMSSLPLQKTHESWDVVCVTDANGGGRALERTQEFQLACEALGARPLASLNYPDVFDRRLDVHQLRQDLFELSRGYAGLYTHGPIGEYGHPHHQDTSFAVHEVGLERGVPVWSIAYNSKADEIHTLDKKQFAQKLKILVEIYGQETAKFLNFLSCSYAEGFAQVSIEEVRALYGFLAERRPLAQGLLPHHGMLREWIVAGDFQKSLKAFFSSYFSDSESV